MSIEQQQNLLDLFAASALQALISKMPFYDVNGEYGTRTPQEELTKIKKGVTETAYEYASYMLIARKKQESWLLENSEYFSKQNNQI